MLVNVRHAASMAHFVVVNGRHCGLDAENVSQRLVSLTATTAGIVGRLVIGGRRRQHVAVVEFNGLKMNK